MENGLAGIVRVKLGPSCENIPRSNFNAKEYCTEKVVLWQEIALNIPHFVLKL